MPMPIDGQEMWKLDKSVTKIYISEHFCAFQIHAPIYSTSSLDLAGV